MKPKLVKRGVWILAREFIFLTALLYDNQHILTAVVHENDNNLTRPQTENNCNTYSTNTIYFSWTSKQRQTVSNPECRPRAPDMSRNPVSSKSSEFLPHLSHVNLSPSSPSWGLQFLGHLSWLLLGPRSRSMKQKLYTSSEPPTTNISDSFEPHGAFKFKPRHPYVSRDVVKLYLNEKPNKSDSRR